MSKIIEPKKLSVSKPCALLENDSNFVKEKDECRVEVSENVGKMLNGELYDSMTTELVSARAFAKLQCQKIGLASPLDEDTRHQMFKELFGQYTEGSYIEPPFYCDYGSNIYLTGKVYMNHNCVLLDCAPIIFGKNVFLAPAVQIYTASHPLDPILRRTMEDTKPVVIGDDVWIGGGAIILPGITIGNGSTIGAGSVVTKNVPSYCVVAGNPARILKTLPQPVEV